MFDPAKPAKLKETLVDTNNGNWYQKGDILQPGALPIKWWNEVYCENLIPSVPSPIAGANIPESIAIDLPIDKVSKIIGHDKLSINTCTIEQLIGIEGISTAAADKIVKDRESKGMFGSLQALLERMPTLAKHSSVLEERFSFEAG